jgi:hypothetical protein
MAQLLNGFGHTVLKLVLHCSAAQQHEVLLNLIDARTDKLFLVVKILIET